MDAFSVLTSDNGGESWKKNLSYSGGFFVLNHKMAWVCQQADAALASSLYKTNDAGATWSVKRIGRTSYYPCNLFFVSPSNGWYSLGPKQFFETSDGGETWREKSSLPEKFVVHTMYWFDTKKGVVSGYFENTKDSRAMFGKGALLKTVDAGKTWQHIGIDSDSPFFDEVFFSDGGTGVLTTRDEIFISNDAGKNWAKIFSLPKQKKQ